MKVSVLISLGFLVLTGWGRAQNAAVLETSLVEASGLTFADGSETRFANRINGGTYQQQSLSSFLGYQYTVYYDSNRHVCVGRRKLPAGAWEIARLTDYRFQSNDSHNVAALGICQKDGTIHLAFDHHADDLNYRVSVLGVALDPESVTWGAGLFGPVTDRLGAVGQLTKVTYPRFFPSPNGNLMMYYRFGGSGSGDGMIHEYDGRTHDWTRGMGQFISRSGRYDGVLSSNSTTRNPYINGISYGGNRLHASWGWRESSGGAQFNHDLCYAYSDDHGRTWRNNAGALIATTGTSFITVNSPGLNVANIPQNIGLSNQYTHFAFPDGRCHVVVDHEDPVTGVGGYQHYWRSVGGAWNREAIPLSGSRPKLAGDDDGSLYLVFVVGRELRIARGTPNATRTRWSWVVIRWENGSKAGGEGQFDLDRWQGERVLSIYDQESADTVVNYGNGTPVDGLPTPLRVRDYQVSSMAILPVPEDGATGMSLDGSLSWTAGLNAGSHRVYVGTDSDAVASATLASPEYRGEVSHSTFSPAGLRNGETYYWRVDEVAGGSVAASGIVWSFETREVVPLKGGMVSLADDASVRDNGSVVDRENITTLLGSGGSSSSRVDRCTVFVFQLPDYGLVGDPFGNASLEFEYLSKQGTLKNCDLYGLGRREMAEVKAGDYYGQTSDLDATDAILLERDILTNSSSPGQVRSSGESLRDYLNGQYEGGLGAGKFVFLRLNTAGPKDGIDRATISMSESEGRQPRIDFNLGFELTAIQAWRMEHFLTASNLGDGADDADPNGDGEGNFYEFATGQNPQSNSRATLRVMPGDGGFQFEYQRGLEALQNGFSFIVEWSDTLQDNSWSSVGITLGTVQPNGTSQLVKVTVPTGVDGSRFVRLRVLE